ncbi:hypothetical protein EJ07DRAFT_181349 [Lizonia empirigonia]|nr:hypothetical protein EJ07DRAFT_181349 [Lizonia empirigonia]
MEGKRVTADNHPSAVPFKATAGRVTTVESRQGIFYTQPSNAELHGDLYEFEKENSTSTSNSTTTFRKRYVTINPGTGAADDRLWPNGKIQYCFESSATKELFFEDLLEARKLWENSGLGADFDWVEKDSSFCNNNANRPNFLLIVESDGLSCTTRVPPPNKLSGDPENIGPLMRLTADGNIGKQNLVANFAHQMGHAWGLHHEHQNPAWWSSDYAAADGNIFSASNFKCENLADYSSVSQTLSADDMKACTSRAFAKAHRFSAAEYLPITDSTAYRASKKFTEPGWESIMIYGSGIESVLTKPNGDQIKQNLAPSQQDVQGLKQLYSVSPSSKFNPFGSKSNAKKNTFNDIRKKERGSGCGEVPSDDPSGQVECSPASCGIPATSDPTWGFLNKPTTGELDAFTQEVFDSRPFQVDLTDPAGQHVSTAIFTEFKNGPFFAAIRGLYRCTSSHHWEVWWKRQISDDDFRNNVITPLVNGDVDNPSFLGFPQLPGGCFTAANDLKATIFAPTFLAGTTAKYAARKAELVTAVATSLNIPESDVNTQLYDANYDDNFLNEAEDPNLNRASGKVFLTYNPDIFKDQSMAAYQVWAGTLVDGVKQANSAINTAIMQGFCELFADCLQDRWKPSFSSKKRALLSYLGWA